eukprot:15471535-Alexandrium_andersonii.AAC.1
MLAFSINVGATRFDRFDRLLGSIGTRYTRHRVPPWIEPASLSKLGVIISVWCLSAWPRRPCAAESRG